MTTSAHYVAIVGGAVSGSEAAFQLTQRGIRTAVFEQNALPYGKIEDGLPKWHVRLRNKEEEKINQKLNHPLVQYIPNVCLGKDIHISELLNDWGFSAVILANGAWNDRPLPIEGIDDYIGRGFCYQNQFINWYNHHHEPGYTGEQFDTPDGAVVIGGGLASLDVVKVLMFKNVEKALKKRGIDADVFGLDRSITKALGDLNISQKDLRLEGCHLYYRRRVIDMPLTPMDTDTPEKLSKAQKVREKVFLNYQSKYLFSFHPQHTPIDKIVEDGMLKGLVFAQTRIVNGRASVIEGSEKEIRAPLFISSIGSLPAAIEGIPMNGSVYDVIEPDSCRVSGFRDVFAIGNAVTGRGNIIESMKHGRAITQEIIEKFGYPAQEVQDQVGRIESSLEKDLTPQEIEELQARIIRMQLKVGYDGDYPSWVQRHMPTRLEDLLDNKH